MKGILQRTEKGWQIVYEVLNSFRIIKVHPNEIEGLDEDDGGEVYFEQEEDEDGITYAILYPNEEISDEEIEKEAAIDFLKWVGGSYSFGNIAGKWYLHENTNKEYTEEQLYKLYLEQTK